MLTKLTHEPIVAGSQDRGVFALSAGGQRSSYMAGVMPARPDDCPKSGRCDSSRPSRASLRQPGSYHPTRGATDSARMPSRDVAMRVPEGSDHVVRAVLSIRRDGRDGS